MWVKNQIKYNANGGIVNPSYKEIEVNASTYGILSTPTKSGYVFVGWYTDAVDGTLVEASTTYTKGISATTLYAHWKPTAATFIRSKPELVNVAGALRYVGGTSTTNNYVYFNGNEKWRIIGVYNDKLKIVKSENPLASQKYNNSGEGNIWEGSKLQLYLNGAYYDELTSEAQEMIVEGIWNVGGTQTNETAITSYEAAQLSTYVNKVGLIALYEYLYAASDNSCYNIVGWFGSYNVSCGTATNNWLSPDNNMWTLSYSSFNNATADYVYCPNGCFYTIDDIYKEKNAYLVVYLNSNVIISDGEGTAQRPYTVSLFHTTY